MNHRATPKEWLRSIFSSKERILLIKVMKYLCDNKVNKKTTRLETIGGYKFDVMLSFKEVQR